MGHERTARMHVHFQNWSTGYGEKQYRTFAEEEVMGRTLSSGAALWEKKAGAAIICKNKGTMAEMDAWP